MQYISIGVPIEITKKESFEIMNNHIINLVEFHSGNSIVDLDKYINSKSFQNDWVMFCEKHNLQTSIGRCSIENITTAVDIAINNNSVSIETLNLIDSIKYNIERKLNSDNVLKNEKAFFGISKDLKNYLFTGKSKDEYDDNLLMNALLNLSEEDIIKISNDSVFFLDLINKLYLPQVISIYSIVSDLSKLNRLSLKLILENTKDGSSTPLIDWLKSLSIENLKFMLSIYEINDELLDTQHTLEVINILKSIGSLAMQYDSLVIRLSQSNNNDVLLLLHKTLEDLNELRYYRRNYDEISNVFSNI